MGFAVIISPIRLYISHITRNVIHITLNPVETCSKASGFGDSIFLSSSTDFYSLSISIILLSIVTEYVKDSVNSLFHIYEYPQTIQIEPYTFHPSVIHNPDSRAHIFIILFANQKGAKILKRQCHLRHKYAGHVICNNLSSLPRAKPFSDT